MPPPVSQPPVLLEAKNTSGFMPQFFAILLSLCLGLFLAEVRINRLESERSAQLARSYLLLINPLLAEKAEPPRT